MFNQMIKTKFRLGILFCLSLSCCLIQSTTTVDAFQAEGTLDANPNGAPTEQDATKIALEYAPIKGKAEPHPDFILPSIDGGEAIQLSKYRGKKVLLLHFASW